MKKRRKTGLVVCILLIVLLLFVLYSNNVITVSRYTAGSGNLPLTFDGYKIVQLTDWHSKQFGRDNERLVHKVRAEHPDIIVMTGDMVNSTDQTFDGLYRLAEKLVDIADVYYIVGNHEQMLSDQYYDAMLSTLESIGVHVLTNEKTTLSRSGEAINLYGLSYSLTYYSDKTKDYIADQPDLYYFSRADIVEILGEKDAGFTLLLTHNPVYFDTYTDWGADLTLCGHMHGGMIRLPFVGGIFSPEKTWFPTYEAGVFEQDGRRMIVGRGLGNGNFGFRLFNNPELVVLTLKAD
mgnify:CR=1 FL=1